MKDSISIDLIQVSPRMDLLAQLQTCLSNFEWNSEQNEHLGCYITGECDGVKIDVWHKGTFLSASISYYGAWVDSADREVKKMISIADIQRGLATVFRLDRIVM